MDMELKERFIELWKAHFDGAELPITFYYAAREDKAELEKPPSRHRCLIGQLSKVRRGVSLYFNIHSLGCGGAKKYTGFTDEVMPYFEYFLSCGIPGRLEGERYKKSPDLVKAAVNRLPEFRDPTKLLVFKRWDKLHEPDNPEVVVFFARPDLLSGLFALANFDIAEPEAVIAPFAAGCGSVVLYPYLERNVDCPRAVVGMFDVSARPSVPKDVLSFALPMRRFIQMIGNMEESFLITGSWSAVKRRIRS